MAELLAGGLRLNLLSLEAIAAAQTLDADIWLAAADRNDALLDAARQTGVTVRTVEA